MEGPRLPHDPFREDGDPAVAQLRGHPSQTKARAVMKLPTRPPAGGPRITSNGADSMMRRSMQELRLRPYHDLEGAIFRPEAGWLIPATYGPADAEVRAVRTRAGMIDWSDRAKIRLTGSERVTFLDGIVTADMK